jgi:hypothetical protein
MSWFGNTTQQGYATGIHGTLCKIPARQLQRFDEGLGVVVHICNPSYLGDREIGRIVV